MKQAHKIGALFYVAWGLLHLYPAWMTYVMGSGMEHDMIGARVVQAGWNLGIFSIISIGVGLWLNWKNDLTGYWINLVVISLADIGFILFVMDLLPMPQAIFGPTLWILAVIFSTIGIRQRDAADVGATAAAE